MSSNAYGEEKPLGHAAVVIRFCLRVEPEFVFLIIMLSEIEKDGRGLKNGEIVTRAIHYDRNPTIRVEFNEP
jgi:hypothetical protein